MNDLELLYLVLALVYVWECACWVPRGRVVFRTWLSRRWRLVQPGELLGNQRGGFVFAAPLPPLGVILCAGPSVRAVPPNPLLHSYNRTIRASLDANAVENRCVDLL